MTVAELMASLLDMPDEAIVVQRGYETGMDEIRAPKLRRIFMRKPPFESYNGEYQSYYDGSDGELYAVVLGDAG